MELMMIPVDRKHPSRIALTYGPVVLVQEQDPKLLLSKPNLRPEMKPTGKPLVFATSHAAIPVMKPFYSIGLGRPYSMYFDLA
jgi:hypothetical protein